MRIKKKLFMGIAATTAAVALGGGIAFAVWSVSGSGSGGATATVASTLTVNQIVPTGAGANLYPGGVSGVAYTITNPNPFAVTVTSVTWGTPTSNNTTSCPSANVAIDASAPTTVSLAVPANSTSSAFVTGGVLDMLHTAPNGCQGVSFNVPMTVTGTQQ
jgi:hypothetical protein